MFVNFYENKNKKEGRKGKSAPSFSIKVCAIDLNQ